MYSRLRGGVGVACFAIVALAVAAPATACDFPPVRQAIDTVIDKDAEKGRIFRKQFKEGTDPIAALEELVPPDMRTKLDVCRFDVAEYLTKRGFPPFH